jgi:hypothetical protein
VFILISKLLLYFELLNRIPLETKQRHAIPCRSIGAVYKESVVYKGIHSFRYSADFGDMSTDPELKCFCATPETCMKKGVHDLTRCSGKAWLRCQGVDNFNGKITI